MPGGPNSVIIGSYLSGCRAHGDARRGQRAVKHLLWLEPGSGDRMKLVGDVVASSGGADEAMKTRWLIRERGLESTSGVSSVEVDGVVHEFVVGGDSGHRSGEGIYEMVEMMKWGMFGFVGCMDEEEGLSCDCLFFG
ncbi:Pentatricopeptide repeat-containing protein [Acorus calamus]|uniref:Pentatricopeptide repeat-containing protein n=1 Tax=Acorus calamus TaxID=4465 RepID=A0AAV9EBT9_ACOCL|nr:Pentatricopeptide repeat-containing protein [Acorus calamus]